MAMSPSESRKLFRRQAERRTEERRQLDYPFMSPEWLNRVQMENMLWPKKDRRVSDRRSTSRRQKSRRSKNAGKYTKPKVISNNEILTPEEKQMLRELSQQND